MNIDQLDLNTRSWCALKRAGITDSETLLKYTDEELLKIPYINKKCVIRIRESLFCLDCKNSIYFDGTCEENELNFGGFDSSEHHGFYCKNKKPGITLCDTNSVTDGSSSEYV